MKNFEQLNTLILNEINDFNPKKIIEINSLQELTSMGGGSVSGGMIKTPKKNKTEEEKLTEEDNEMGDREDIAIETMLRKYIRNKINTTLQEKKTAALNEEKQLRAVIRTLIQEADISDMHPHRSTGINVLEDLLKKMIPTLRTDYKRLTTDDSQRSSFRAHIIKAIKDSLLPLLVNDEYLQSGEQQPKVDAAGPLLTEPVGDSPETELDDEEIELAEVEIELEDTPDEEKKIPIEDDDTPSEEEEFGVQGMDETGRNMAFNTFKKVQQYILDSYDMLANPKDKKIFTDYLITNTKLYFDKFEDELATSVDEPSTAEYDKAKSV